MMLFIQVLSVWQCIVSYVHTSSHHITRTHPRYIILYYPFHSSIIHHHNSSLPERERHLEDLANDIEKFHALVQQLREHKAALEKKVHDSSKQLQEQEDTLEKKEAKLDHLRQVIENQEFSMDDIHKLESEVANIQEKIRQTKIAKEKNEDVTLNKALELNKLFDDLHVIAEDFNLKLVRLFQNGNGNGNGDGNVSDNDKISAHIISIQKTCAHDEDQKALLGGLDLMESMNVWRKEKIKLSEKNSQLRRDVFELTDKKEESEEVVKETNGNIEVSLYVYCSRLIAVHQGIIYDMFRSRFSPSLSSSNAIANL